MSSTSAYPHSAEHQQRNASAPAYLSPTPPSSSAAYSPSPVSPVSAVFPTSHNDSAIAAERGALKSDDGIHPVQNDHINDPEKAAMMDNQPAMQYETRQPATNPGLQEKSAYNVPQAYTEQYASHNKPQSSPQVQSQAQSHSHNQAIGYTTSLSALSKTPASVSCPRCSTISTTTIHKEVGTQANLWSLCLCLFAGVCFAWIPCVMDDCKDTLHTCAYCGLPLAVVSAGGTCKVAPEAQGLRKRQEEQAQAGTLRQAQSQVPGQTQGQAQPGRETAAMEHYGKQDHAQETGVVDNRPQHGQPRSGFAQPQQYGQGYAQEQTRTDQQGQEQGQGHGQGYGQPHAQTSNAQAPAELGS